MPAPLSILIPTLNAETGLKQCLPTLMEGLELGLVRELVISDGGSTDATLRIAEAAGAVVVTGDPGRGGQLRRGAERCQGDWMLALHADSHLEDGWSEAVARHMHDHPAAAGYFWLRFDARGLMPLIVSRWANLRSRVFGLPYGDQGLLVARDLYHAAGGYEAIPLMEDVALVRRLEVLRPLGRSIETSAERYVRGGWARRGARNLWTLARYFAGASPETLAQQYRRR